MRILFIVHQFLPEFSAGTEQVTLNLAKAAQRAGHHVDILACALDPAAWSSPDSDGLHVAAVRGLRIYAVPGAMVGDPYGFNPGSDRQARAVFDRFLERGRYDLVHAMHGLRMLDALECVRARGIPYVMTFTDFFQLCYRINLMRLDGDACAGPRGGATCAVHCAQGSIDAAALSRRQAALSRLVASAAERVACSSVVAGAFAAEYPDLPVRVIGHGIDLLRFRPGAVRAAGAPLVFGYLGTLSAPKGVAVLAEAFAGVAAPNARLELVGPVGDDERVARHVQDLAALDPRISWRGAAVAAEVPAVLAGFDVLCLPSLLPETFSLALHEGFAAGLPALVSEHGNLAAVVTSSGCGRCVTPGDIAAWRAAIADIVAAPSLIATWRQRLVLPLRVEEEAFLYDQLYRLVA